MFFLGISITEKNRSLYPNAVKNRGELQNAAESDCTFRGLAPDAAGFVYLPAGAAESFSIEEITASA